MLLLSSILLFLVGLMHSALGGSRLINPILLRDDLPVILGSVKNSKMTLLIGWHALTLFWWGQATVLAVLHFDRDGADQVFLGTLSIACGIIGVIALFVSRGKHLSWVFLLPISVLSAFAAFS